MDATDILRDAASRPLEAARSLREHLDPRTLTVHLQGHDNSIAWLLWHSAREIDGQVAHLTGRPEVWTAGGFRERFALGEAADGIGYGHTAQEARSIDTTDADLLLAYLEAATDALEEHLAEIGPEDLDTVIDETFDPPVTRGTRLVSLIDDAAQHMGQAAFIVGALR